MSMSIMCKLPCTYLCLGAFMAVALFQSRYVHSTRPSLASSSLPSLLESEKVSRVRSQQISAKGNIIANHSNAISNVTPIQTPGKDAVAALSSNLVATALSSNLVKHDLVTNYLSYIIDYKAFLDKKKAIGQKFFFITWGPPGSGKSLVLDSARDTLANLWKPLETNLESYIDVNVDAMVKAIPEYEEQRTFFCEPIQDAAKKKDCTQGLYNGARRDLGINRISDEVQEKAVREGYHVMMEMTGRWLDEKWFSGLCQSVEKEGYKMVVLYPVTPVDKLIKRAQIRQQKTGQEPAPVNDIRAIAKSASELLPTVAKHVSAILLFDNAPDRNPDAGRVLMPFLFAYQKNYLAAECEVLKAWFQTAAFEVPLIVLPGSVQNEDAQAQMPVIQNLKNFILASSEGNGIKIKQIGDKEKTCEALQ